MEKTQARERLGKGTNLFVPSVVENAPALQRLRYAFAYTKFCPLLNITNGGTTSHRNRERSGFRVAYSTVTVIKKL
ncbi:MAG: hypothetical protein WAN65_25240 [Candidatus Sulfotelmatobacter sp.]